MIALPIVPPITDIQVTRYEILNTDYYLYHVGDVAKHSDERLTLTFLFQAKFYMELIKKYPDSIAVKAYATLANSNYRAYLTYSKQYGN